MKHLKLILVLVAVLSAVSAATARTWRVNPNPASGAPHNDITELLASSEFADGDTILCDPGNYGSIDIARDNFTIIGNGYDLNTNTDWAEVQTVNFSYINLDHRKNCTFIGLNASFYVGHPTFRVIRVS